MKRLIVGTVGLPGAGKTTIANYLSKKGFFSIRLSSFLEDGAKERYGKISRETLQNVGNELRKKYGSEILAKLAIGKSEGKEKIVIDGIRNLEEINFLKKQGNFFLLGIKANSKIRYERLLKIKEKSLPKWEEFLRLDARDKGKGQTKSGLQVNKCFEMADFIIEHNSQDPKGLYEKLDKLFKNDFLANQK